jgi:hypothetical protein
MRRITYSNVAATLALLIAVSGGVVYAANRIGPGQIKRNAVRSKHIKNGQVRGKDVLESSLGSVPAADSVGGITQEPVSFAMTSPDDQGEQPLSIGGSLVKFSCTAAEVEVRVKRGLGGPPIIAQLVRNSANPTVERPAENTFLILQADRVGVVGTIRESSGQIMRLQADAFFLTDAYGGPEDCFVQGTIERFTG